MKPQKIKKILVSCWLSEGIQMLIPKQRGEGFLKTPVGHHHEHWLHLIDYDLCGLDGHLDIDCDINNWETEKRDKILTVIMPIITKRFKFDWELIDSQEFEEVLSRHIWGKGAV